MIVKAGETAGRGNRWSRSIATRYFATRQRDYRCPSEADAGEVVTFYFRTEKNGADAVVLLECDPETGALCRSGR